MSLTPEQAREVFDAIGRSGVAVASLGEAAQLDARGELSELELVEVVHDYLNAQMKLEEVRARYS